MGRVKKPATKSKIAKKTSSPQSPAVALVLKPITETAKKRKLSVHDEEGIIYAFQRLGMEPREIKESLGLRISAQTIYRIAREYFEIQRAENEKRVIRERKEGKILFATEHSTQNWNDVSDSLC